MSVDFHNNQADKLNEGYANLSKWIIGLATGTIVFSVKLVNSSTSQFWKSSLAFGLGLLLISIILGVRSVRLRLDGIHYNKLSIKFGEMVEQCNLQENSNIGEFKSRKQEMEKKFDSTNRDLIVCFYWQQRLFYFGLLVVGIFGIYSIQ